MQAAMKRCLLTVFLVTTTVLSYADEPLSVPDYWDNKDHSILKASLAGDRAVTVICSQAFAKDEETTREVRCALNGGGLREHAA
jgi:hypothetical protein